MARIAVIDEGYDSYRYEQDLCQKHGYSFAVFSGDRHDRAAKLHFAREAEGILVRWTVVDEKFLEALPHLKAIVRYGTGYDNIDIAAVKARRIRIANVQGYASHSVSDHALMLLLSCCRGVMPAQNSFLASYTQPPFADILELQEMTLGIVGLGRIGGTLCKKSLGLFKRVLACDPYISATRFTELRATACDLPFLLQHSDAISLHCSLTAETRHLIGERQFALMIRRPVLVNTARGPVIDERALWHALQQDRIHSAGLDVFSDEPPQEDMRAVLQHPRVVATGHYGWYSVRAGLEMQKRAADNLLGLLLQRVIDDEL